MLLSRLRMLPAADFSKLPDASEGLGNRLYAAVADEPTLRRPRRRQVEALRPLPHPADDDVRLPRYRDGMAEGVRPMPDSSPPPSAAASCSARPRTRPGPAHHQASLRKTPAPGKPRRFRARGEVQGTSGVLAYRAAAERRGGSDWRTGPAMV